MNVFDPRFWFDQIEWLIARIATPSYDSDGFENLDVDNGTLTVSIPTPKGWTCSRPGCTTDWRHTHGTFADFKPEPLRHQKNGVPGNCGIDHCVHCVADTMSFYR